MEDANGGIMSRITVWFSNSTLTARAALARFPYVLLCAWIATVAAIISINQSDTYEAWQRFLMAAILGVPLEFSLTTIRERLGKSFLKFPLELAGIVLLVIYFFTLPAYWKNVPDVYWMRFFFWLAAAHFFVAVAPFLAKPSAGGFWQFNRRLFLRFFLATLYTCVLIIGLELALMSADHLFDLHLGDAYDDLFFLILGIFHPWFFLAGVPQDYDALEAGDSFPKGLRAFTQFALAPLVAAYIVILYVYGIKILVTLEWPHGWVALPVIALSIVGILAALLLYPQRAKPDERWAAWFWRWFFRALAPLSILLLLSLRERIHAYGVTESRYIGVVAGLWILTASLLYCFRPRTGIRWIPVSLTAICLLAAFGPWGAFWISQNSQYARLGQQLQKFGLWQNGRAVPKNQKLDDKDYQKINSQISYLISNHGVKSLTPAFAKAHLVYKDTYNPGKGAMAWLKLTSDSENGNHVFTMDSKTPVNLAGWQHLYAPRGLDGQETFGKLQLKFEYEGKIYAKIGGGPYEALPMSDFFKKIWEDKKTEKTVQDLHIDWPKAAPRYRIYFLKLKGYEKPSGGYNVYSCKVMVLER